MIQVCRTGRNPTMRHLGRTHGISIQWLHDETTKDTCELHYIETSSMAADIFTKFFPQSKASTWTEARMCCHRRSLSKWWETQAVVSCP